MEFSAHYPAFVKRTVIVLTNTERARILAINARDVEELESITIAVRELPDFDAHKAAQLIALGNAISKKLVTLLSAGGFEDAILCVPEVNREQLLSAINPDVLARCSSIVPKNLCAMEIGTVMRILLEG